MAKANADIRAELKAKNIPVYAVADVLRVHENTVFAVYVMNFRSRRSRSLSKLLTDFQSRTKTINFMEVFKNELHNLH